MIDFLKKVWAWIVSVPQDKLLHFAAILLVALFSFDVFFFFLRFWPAVLWANLVAVVIGVGKELYDAVKKEGHSAEWKDLAADGAGLLVADLFLLVLFFAMIV